METFIGVIAKVLDQDLYKIEVDIPGKQERLKAFPFRGEVDEPRVGDVVFLRELDPIYHSYYLYEKLKENKFIGIRARGKKILMSEELIQIGIFPPDTSNSNENIRFPDTLNGDWYDNKSEEDPTPSCTSWLQIDKGGNIDIEMEGAGTMHISADHTVKIDGACSIEVANDANINVSGSTTLKSPNVEINGNVTVTGGTFTAKGDGTPETKGAFCAIPSCLLTGAPHKSTMTSGN